MRNDYTMTADMRLALVALAIVKPLCWLRVLPVDWAAALVVKCVRIRIR